MKKKTIVSTKPVIYIKDSSAAFIDEFVKFITRGNVVEITIGLIVGSGFTALINSLVKDIITPLLNILTNRVDFNNLYINLSGGTYSSIDEAIQSGAVIVKYGAFITELINFVIISFVVFLVLRKFLHYKSEKSEKVLIKTKKSKATDEE